MGMHKFNAFKDLRSHSAALFNERLAYYFFLLDAKSMNFKAMKTVPKMYDLYSVLDQIYVNIRTFIRYNPFVRVTLKLETKVQGIYLTDVMISNIRKMITYCENYGFTDKRIEIIGLEMRRFELLIRDILQYSQYFIKADYKQKPDIEIATEKYKEMVDERTVEELKEIVGEKALIDFNELLYKRDRFEVIEEGEDIELQKLQKNKGVKNLDTSGNSGTYNNSSQPVIPPVSSIQEVQSQEVQSHVPQSQSTDLYDEDEDFDYEDYEVEFS